ncbi:bifunctional pyr operon transcriptional regulator/uracil phosphoribosyltransferase PyrR [Schleiferiaceae bacterium]|jgi:pyrimidine operon attenuation protein/uracil phosphoribosyltransferase|nr:bifunctional pyr operon transcriptional regulator/uracil phosphoribosyltransferase PyrR [Schleiferiaceae bacterium]MDB2473392.1 bifunctional pyr operon transcriptional regulator/uracil phosphoribosyltransferase PyrR [Schleiferiaceae bacterium]
MSKREIIDSRELNIALNRLCCKLIENHGDFSNSILIGLQPRGAQVLQRIVQLLENEYKVEGIRTGLLDITFYRDDFRRREGHLQPNKTKIDFLVEDQKVVFIDDVLYTGRSVRAAMDAILSFGRPSKMELLTLIDRRFSRDLPIQPDYKGRQVDSIESQRVEVLWEEINGRDAVLLTEPNS